MVNKDAYVTKTRKKPHDSNNTDARLH